MRGCAYNQGCYEDLMEIREHVLEYLKTLKEVTYHTNPDESDDLETAKLIETKPLSTNGGNVCCVNTYKLTVSQLKYIMRTIRLSYAIYTIPFTIASNL